MKKYCYVRFDDICPTMNWENFYRAVDLIEQYCEGKAMLGIIPQNEDTDQLIENENSSFWSIIKDFQNNGWAIALHGFTHVYDQESPNTLICGVKHSEFAGNGYENQKEKIAKGKRVLQIHNIKTDVFFAPAHTYDRNTLKALAANGFVYNVDGLTRRPDMLEGIINIPCRCGGIPKRANNLINIAVLHTNLMTDKDFHRLEEYLIDNSKFLCSFDDIRSIKRHSFVGGKINELFYTIPRNVKHKFGNLLRMMGLR